MHNVNEHDEKTVTKKQWIYEKYEWWDSGGVNNQLLNNCQKHWMGQQHI